MKPHFRYVRAYRALAHMVMLTREAGQLKALTITNVERITVSASDMFGHEEVRLLFTLWDNDMRAPVSVNVEANEMVPIRVTVSRDGVRRLGYPWVIGQRVDSGIDYDYAIDKLINDPGRNHGTAYTSWGETENNRLAHDQLNATEEAMIANAKRIADDVAKEAMKRTVERELNRPKSFLRMMAERSGMMRLVK